MSLSSLPRLYLITERHQTADRPLSVVLSQALEAGARMVQLREKDLETRELCELAKNLTPLFTTHQAHWLINDRVDLVIALEADGVHLRTDSLPVSVARKILGSERLIGISTHSMEELKAAESEGADFAVLGPIYKTPSKRRYGTPLGLQTAGQVCRASRIPVYAIGGVTPERVGELRDAGFYGVAVISSVLQSENIQETIHRFLTLLS